jgi:branched-chain amino acid transport system ATP-binding protein
MLFEDNEPLLHVQDLSISFGGMEALAGVDMFVRKGECLAIIGPNGAGKTTFFNLLTGLRRPTRGQIFYKGRDITGLKPYRRGALGIARTFQITSVFRSLSVLENVLIGVQRARDPWKPFGRAIRESGAMRAEAEALIESVGIADKMLTLVSDLGYGDQRLVELALALSTRPEVVMLDEPTAGLSPRESNAFAGWVENMRLRHDVTVMLIEHDMNIVMEIASRIVVLHLGKTLATGTPQDIMANDEVTRVYLGRDARAQD